MAPILARNLFQESDMLHPFSAHFPLAHGRACRWWVFVFLALLTSALPLGAQVRLESNLFLKNYPNGFNPQSFAKVGDSYVFMAEEGWEGKRHYAGLWRTNLRKGTTRHLASLLLKSPLVSLSYSAIRPLGGEAFTFSSLDPLGRTSLFFSDGTPEGTLGPFRYPFALQKGGMIFSPDGEKVLMVDRMGIQLFDPRSRKGTILYQRYFGEGNLVSILPSPPGKWRVLFFVNQGLWVSDGTKQGTRFVAPISADAPSPFQHLPEAPVVNGQILFFADLKGTLELWSIGLDLKKPQRLFKLRKLWEPCFLGWRGKKAVFGGGAEVFETDGTPKGTRVLLPASMSILDCPVLLNAKFFFPKATPQTGREIFVSDGTPAGTKLFMDLVPGPKGSLVKDLRRSADRFFFGTEKLGVFVSDGTVAGTRALNPQLRFAKPALGKGRGSFVPTPGGGLLFGGQVGQKYSNPYFSDGTPAGTKIFEEVHPRSDGDSSPDPLIPGAQGLFFQARQAGTNDTLQSFFFKSTNGRVGKGFGTQRYNQWFLPYAVMTLGARLVYSKPTIPSSINPWLTDGTPRGSFSLKSFFNPPPKVALSVQGSLGTETIFWDTDLRFWRSDGTKKGTVYLGQPFKPQKFWATQVLPGIQRSWILLSDQSKVSLWKLDRGAPALVKVKSLAASTASDNCFQAIGDRCVFQVKDPVKGFQLWGSDGSAAGTKLLRNVPNSLTANPEAPPLVLGAKLYLYGEIASGQLTFYSSDGTVKGTGVAFVVPAAKMRWIEAAGTNEHLFMRGSNPKTGPELWISDGTQKGTQLLKDLVPGPIGGSPTRMGRIGSRRIFFYAYKPETGYELWVSDGTRGGTHMLQDLYPGINPSKIPGLVYPPRFQGGRIYFSGMGPKVGFELHSMGSGAVAEVIGGGCTDRVFPLHGTDPVLGGKATVRGENPKGAGLRVLLLGKPALRLVPLPGGCAGVLDPSAPPLVLDAASSTGGSWTRKYSIPKLPSLNGVQLALQAFYWKPGSPPKASQGLAWALGS